VNSFVLAYFGGIVCAVLMDITETFAARVGLTSGVSVALVGRWVLGLLRGQWAHADIARYPARPGELRTGWAFHFFVGGGGVALLYAAFVDAMGFNLPTPMAAAAAGLRLGLVRPPRAALVQRPAGQHGFTHPLRAWRRGRDGVGLEPPGLMLGRTTRHGPAPAQQSIGPVTSRATKLTVWT
jgi:hypothetical protein